MIDKAKAFTVFIYAHHKNLSLMRKFTKKEIIHLGVTRLATSFLTLQSLLDKKQQLRNMMTTMNRITLNGQGAKSEKKHLILLFPMIFGTQSSCV